MKDAYEVWENKIISERTHREACMKAAIEILRINPRNSKDIITVPNVIKIARQLERYIIFGDVGYE